MGATTRRLPRRPHRRTERMRARLAPARPQRESGTLGAWWARLRSAPALSGLALAAVALLVLSNVYWFGRVNGLERRAAAGESALAGLANATAIELRAEALAPGAQGVVYKSTDGQTAVLCVYGMPALPAGKAYQLWLTNNGGRESGGLFTVSDYGFGLLIVRPGRALREYSGLGVTVEPAGGSAGPTSPRVIGGSL
jgi:anti-sigma-K factor RskA